MLPIIESFNLLRYLIVWRVNHPLVQAPDDLATALSTVLGALIAERLPSSEAREWQKTRAAWDKAYGAVDAAPDDAFALTAIPGSPWPLDVVLRPYPTKPTYGEGEKLVWELTLLGANADHGLFLEYLLPAFEAAALTTDARWKTSNGLWGHFDIQAVYAARGLQWEPVVTAGKLHLDYRATATQWAEGLPFDAPGKQFRRLTWLTPFDFAVPAAALYLWQEQQKQQRRQQRRQAQNNIPDGDIPTLEGIVHALMARLATFLPGKRRTVEDVWALLPAEMQTPLWDAFNTLQQAGQHGRHHLRAAPKDRWGRWIGWQTFAAPIPKALTSYLELASILHVGNYTHFGCGTFMMQ